MDQRVERTRLSGWKAMARFLGRSERTLQLWEAERALPVHRLPGQKGSTVYAWAEEIDAWMANAAHDDEPRPATSAAIAAPPAAIPGRPGLLVLPFERRPGDDAPWDGAVFAEDLIARFAFHQPAMRIVSARTSRSLAETPHATVALWRELGVRYLIEGSVTIAGPTATIDVRGIDAELDQVLSIVRFRLPRDEFAGAQSLLARTIVDHFSLVVDGALIEPLCLHEAHPDCFTSYLEAVRHFADATSVGLHLARSALDRAIAGDTGFLAAHALRGLVMLQLAVIGEMAIDDALATARSVAAVWAPRCARDASARLTMAFLDAAIVVESRTDRDRAGRRWANALSAMPPSVASRGRLFERRSHRRCEAAGVGPRERRRSGASSIEHGIGALDAILSEQPGNLFASVMREMLSAYRTEPAARREE